MAKRTALVLAAVAALWAGTPALAQDIKLIDTNELSGPGAPSGTNFQKGADLAVKEINASGGILGHKVTIQHLDNQSNIGAAKAMAQKALDDEPYALLGPTFSSDVMITMAAADQAEIPQFMGGEAAALTEKGYHYTFRTSISQAGAMPKLATYMADEAKVHSLAVVWVNNDYGKGGHDTMLPELAKRNIKVMADISTESGQVDFANVVVQVAKSGADALFAYLNEEEAARLLRELRKQGYDKPIFGETVLISQKVIDLAGDAANGVKGHVGLSADAPIDTIRDFDKKFLKEYGFRTDHNGMKGYIAVELIKAVTEKIGKVDNKLLAKTLHGLSLKAKDYPGILLDTAFNDKGDMDRQTFLVEVKDGKQVVTRTLPPLGLANLP